MFALTLSMVSLESLKSAIDFPVIVFTMKWTGRSLSQTILYQLYHAVDGVHLCNEVVDTVAS
eukprot:12907229-Prorocentrum_lima.AAC.1